MRTLALLLVVSSLGRVPQEDAPLDALPPADPAVTSAALEHHVRFLAADELRGRAVATPESRRAARYLARALQRAGLEPMEGAEGFLQPVPFARTSFEAAPALRVQDATGKWSTATHGVDFDLSVRGDPRATGVLDVRRAKAGEALATAPDPGSALVLEGSSREVRAWLSSHDQGRGWGLVVRPGSAKAGKPGRLPRGSFGLAADVDEDGPELVTARGGLLEELEAGRVRAMELAPNGARELVVDYNVVGRITGVGTPERPELARETIVFSAHYDHVGSRPPAEDPSVDTIFNGADDDASGVSVVLELAEAFAAGPPPARTLVFLLATGEERGVLGTRHWVAHPTQPLESVVCNLNFEMLGRPDALVGGPGKLWLTGYERSSLGPAFAERGIDVVADPRPDQNFFVRSDNIVFVREGIVGQTLSSYDLHEDYHNVTDEADTLDYAHMQAAARAGLAAARMLADGSLTPSWNEGEPRLGR